MNARLLFSLVVFLSAAAMPAFAHQPQAPLDLSRIRLADGHTARVFRLALERSAIVRDFVAQIEAGQDLVYVRLSDIPDSLTGRMTLMGRGGGHRYLSVLVSRKLSPFDAIATLAHELEHVLEVMADPEVEDAKSLAALYRRIGLENETGGKVSWDTAAAQRVGHQVRRELATSAHRVR